MDISVTTPALLFPAISLLLLAYTNRFVVLTTVIRQLSRMESPKDKSAVPRQITALRLRLNVIRIMQTLGVLAFVMCALSMLAVFVGWALVGQLLFGLSLLLLVSSLIASLYEVHISTEAITIELERLDNG